MASFALPFLLLNPTRALLFLLFLFLPIEPTLHNFLLLGWDDSRIEARGKLATVSLRRGLLNRLSVETT